MSKVTQLVNGMTRIRTYLSLKPQPLTTMLYALHCLIVFWSCRHHIERDGKGKGEMVLGKIIHKQEE